MFYKGIIFDLDNTLYSYTNSHSIALHETLMYISTIFQIDIEQLNVKYTTISNSLKYELGTTASCHNKNIYFKQLLENHNKKLDQLETINNIYWTTFLNASTLYEGVKEFIQWNRQKGIKIGILTDYETEYQIKKLHKLGLLEYIDIIVTSEEIGIEKPSSQMFHIILNKMNLKYSEVIMIGDDYKKDIEGANNMNIFNYWYTQKPTTQHSFSCWITLHNKFKSIYEDLIKLKQMSRYVGERFDLVQAGGGNSSVKHDEWMFIKASGINMSNITESAGYVVVNNKAILEDIKKKVKDVINYNVLSNTRGSIETYMHSILKKYTLHIHPIQVNRILITKNARTYFSNRFPQALIIDYFTPGIKICDEIKSKYNNENIIFMTNHG
jgi:HAD superfamily hydrolase (TIGR01549 family)